MADVSTQMNRGGQAGSTLASRIVDLGGIFAPEVAVSAPTSRPLPVNQAGKTILSSVAANVAVDQGTTANIDTTLVEEIAVDLFLATLTGGTAPTVQFFYERQAPAGGRWVTLWTSGVLSASGMVSTSIGAAMPTNASIGSIGRIRWTVTGAPASATADLSITGK